MVQKDFERMILRYRLIGVVEGWDRIAAEREDIQLRKRLWNILYALDGYKPSECVIDDLDALEQTERVMQIREFLGIPARDAAADERQA